MLRGRAGSPCGTPRPRPPCAGPVLGVVLVPYTGRVLGISGSEFLVIILVVVIVVGPQRLPEYARKLTQAVRRLRVFLDDAKEQIAEEVGPELADLNLSDLDPRNYDPRKIVRDALGEDLDAIRKDLATPFQSVAKEARETADAVATGTAPRSTKSLTRMIDGKAEETRRGREAQAEPSPSGAPDRDGSEGSSESSCRDSHDVDDTTGGTTAGVPVDAGGAPADDGGRAADGDSVIQAPAADETLDEIPAAEAADEGPDGRVPDPVPSSLVEDAAQDDGDAERSTGGIRVRPVSPRDIVRAANAAARTRAEAATAVVDA